MTADPRAALARLVSALERHLEIASTRRDPDDPGVVAAAEALAEAFDDYDEALFEATEVATPLAVYGDDDFDEDEEEDDKDEDEEAVVSGSDEVATSDMYAGLDDEDVDFDEVEDDGADDGEDEDDDDLDDEDDLDEDDEDLDEDDEDEDEDEFDEEPVSN